MPQEKLAEHRGQLEHAVPAAPLSGMAAGKREYPEPSRPVPAERVSQQELEREEHFKQVRLRQVSTDDVLIPTSKATRGYQ
ncbi:hypothetical protein DUNSADRAFT_13298 [Dunaliella salina]|uniref:Encoded protein n=1 Tax=Dunaliella salina TaxID=3046 RepID=A0ABQ7G9N9_DUNSA|nr:hypothetical protein DUNSADRAFT_13298 [Dunaliella salina]|eukprot:KAF5831324.1 hypothetical protein DUNSADRAFT_13298 [Dunaliella salina]